MARSVNKAIIIGNLTRDPEMRYTPDGQPVTTFGVATNRRWKGKDGEQKESAEFHNLVAWGKLAEICSQLLKKGRRVYVEGRLQTRSWEGKDGVTRSRTEIVLENMVLLDSRRDSEGTPREAAGPVEKVIQVEEGESSSAKASAPEEAPADKPKSKSSSAPGKKGKTAESKGANDEEVSEDEIPF